MCTKIREQIDLIKNLKYRLNEEFKDINILYHGSKYLFNTFDSNKINTGQHSQDFGYGLYFTSNIETAKFYANELSNIKTPIDKYNDVIKKNKKNDILYQYIADNRIISAKRILNNLISDKVGDINEWILLLKYLDITQRYAYVYTVIIKNNNFIDQTEYNALKYKLNYDDKQMNINLLEKGYNGIKYKINSFGLNKKDNFEKDFNVVIIDDKVINITNIEKVEFEGLLKLNLK